MSQTQVAEILGVSRAVLSKWKKEGLLKPSAREKRRSRKKGAMDRYTLRDLVAGVFRQVLTEDLRFRGQEATDMVTLIQQADDETLEHAVILTARTRPPLMRHAFIPDARLAPDDVSGFFYLDRVDFADGYELIEHLKAVDKFISCSTLLECHKAVEAQVQKKLDQDALVATKDAAA